MFTGCNNVIAWSLLTATAVIVGLLAWNQLIIPSIVCAAIGLLFSLSPRIVRDWDRGVMLRLGKFTHVLKPGISWIVPWYRHHRRQSRHAYSIHVVFRGKDTDSRYRTSER